MSELTHEAIQQLRARAEAAERALKAFRMAGHCVGADVAAQNAELRARAEAAEAERDALRAERDEIAREIGHEPGDDPEVQRLPDAVRVSLQYERGRYSGMFAEWNALRKERNALLRETDGGAPLTDYVSNTLGPDGKHAMMHSGDSRVVALVWLKMLFAERDALRAAAERSKTVLDCFEAWLWGRRDGPFDRDPPPDEPPFTPDTVLDMLALCVKCGGAKCVLDPAAKPTDPRGGG